MAWRSATAISFYGSADAADDAGSRHLRHRRLRRPRGEPLKPFAYRDFGSLVSLGEYSTVGSLIGFIAGKGMFIKGYFARLMYRSLYKIDNIASHGPAKVALDTFARSLTRRTEPHVKLH